MNEKQQRHVAAWGGYTVDPPFVLACDTFYGARMAARRAGYTKSYVRKLVAKWHRRFACSSPK